MSQVEILAAKEMVAAAGHIGSKVVLPLDDDKIVTSTNMKVGAYTIAAQPTVPCRITVTATAVGTADTMGTVVFVGTGIDGSALSETVTPVAGSAVSTVNEFASITSATGAGWVIDGGSQNDTIKIGMGAVIAGGFYYEADDDRIVASANMKVGAYTIAAQPQYPTTLTVTATASGDADTMGTVVIDGYDVNDVPIAETVTPVAGSTVTTTKTFKRVRAVTGAGWVIDGGSSNDTIKVGVTAVTVPSQNYLSYLQVTSDAVVASRAAVTGKTIANYAAMTSLPIGMYLTNLTAISFTSGEGIVGLASV